MKAARIPLWLLLAFLMALLVSQFIVFLQHAMFSIQWPNELNYGEGIVWQQTKLMFTPEAYGRIDSYPSIVFHYPPLFHTVTRFLVFLTGADMLSAGRALSVISTVIASAGMAMIIRRAMPAKMSVTGRNFCAFAGALFIFAFSAVAFWATLMRVDMLAFMFSIWGFWFGLKSFDRPWYVYIASLFFVAAIYTKQTSILAPAAMFLLMLWQKPRLALAGISTCVATGLLVFGILLAVTDGRFFDHIVRYNVNRIVLSQLRWLFTVIVENLIFFVVIYVALRAPILSIFKKFRTTSAKLQSPVAADITLIGLCFYFLVASVMLLTVMKSGSDVNYGIEWIFVLCMLVGCSLRFALSFAGGKSNIGTFEVGATVRAFAVPVLLLIQMGYMYSNWNDFNVGYLTSKARALELQVLANKIRAADKDIISDDMVMLIQNGKNVVWEPAIFAELASNGVWDEGPFVARIRRRDFAMFITKTTRGDRLFDSRYSPAVADAMDEAYPVLESIAGYTVHSPAR